MLELPHVPGASPTTQPTPLLVDSPTAARMLACCEKTLWTLRKTGKLPAVRFGKRAVRFRVADLEAFAAGQVGQGATP